MAMGKWRHRLSNIDKKRNLADCLTCGAQVTVKYKGSLWKCNNALREVDRNRKYRRKYGIEPSSIPQSCEVCGSQTRISYDHSHISGKFRGWLCMKCNTALGLVGDNIETLERLIAYLKRGDV